MFSVRKSKNYVRLGEDGHIYPNATICLNEGMIEVMEVKSFISPTTGKIIRAKDLAKNICVSLNALRP